jgi:short subunit dehydrogenase-like uncharacterized protein
MNVYQSSKKKNLFRWGFDWRFFFRGGVLTPGAAFGRTILLDYLEKEGILFNRK